MEDIKGYIELVIAATYSAHTIIAFREAAGDHEPHEAEQDEAREAACPPDHAAMARHQRPHLSPEVVCLLTVTLSYYMLGSLSVFGGH
jgi:hypothetical protein